ncbi:MAG TPA: hypothetical protein VN476_08385 [Pyrinomonadaceae bacterium]|nr:hypothetical protein [Pyrinomonadaceae bacterium]
MQILSGIFLLAHVNTILPFFQRQSNKWQIIGFGSRSNDATVGTILARRQHKFERIKVGVADLRNQQVRFRISDIYLPDPLVILNQLHGEDVLEGRVLDVSDSGTKSEQFAVIEVQGLDQIIIVPLASVNDKV